MRAAANAQFRVVSRCADPVGIFRVRNLNARTCAHDEARKREKRRIGVILSALEFRILPNLRYQSEATSE
jgi:hypothetical protein